MTPQQQHEQDALALCLKQLPRKLKIGAYDWMMRLELEESSSFGEMDFDSQTIKIWVKNMLSPALTVGTVLHECLHVIFELHGLEKMERKKDEREEKIVLGFEAGLVSLLRDNPKLLTWMKRWLGKSL